jgi:hypothetical protein
MGQGETQSNVEAHSISLTIWRKDEEIRARKECNINVVGIVSNLFSEGKRYPGRQRKAWNDQHLVLSTLNL